MTEESLAREVRRRFDASERDTETHAGPTHAHEMCNVYLMGYASVPFSMWCADGTLSGQNVRPAPPPPGPLPAPSPAPEDRIPDMRAPRLTETPFLPITSCCTCFHYTPCFV